MVLMVGTVTTGDTVEVTWFVDVKGVVSVTVTVVVGAPGVLEK